MPDGIKLTWRAYGKPRQLVEPFVQFKGVTVAHVLECRRDVADWGYTRGYCVERKAQLVADGEPPARLRIYRAQLARCRGRELQAVIDRYECARFHRQWKHDTAPAADR